MWNGKLKAITFSFDDGVTQDKRAIQILDKYGLKATFNLNSARFGMFYDVKRPNDVTIRRAIIPAHEIKETYKNHEVAVHTQSHPNLTTLDDLTIIRQVEEDRKALEELVGYKVRSMAYPCGGVNNDDRVAKIIKENTMVKFARTITSTHSFDLQENLYRFNPTVHDCEEELFDLAERFVQLKTDKPQLFYVWGHTYEMDDACELITWEKFEKLCAMIANKADIFYGTNSQVLLDK